MWQYNHTNELAHFGIKGMKWGVRRYQNKDGSLTAMGKRRYSEDVEKAKDNLKVAKKGQKEALKEYNRKTLYGLVYNPSATKKYINATKKVSYAKEDLTNEKLRDKLNSQKKKSNRQLKLEDEYKKSGLSEKEAELAAYKRVKVERTLAVVGGIAATSLIAYAAYKHWDTSVDKIIKPDTLLQNISNKSDKGVSDAFYASMNSLDKTKYRGLYGKQILANSPGSKIYDTTIKVGDKGLKLASQKSAKSALSSLIDSDKEFKNDLVSSLNEIKNYVGNEKQRSMMEQALNSLKSGNANTTAVYEAFNFNLVNHSPTGEKVSKKFYDRMKQLGYDAIKDTNDAKYSGYNSINPIIVFNGSAKTSVDSVRKLGEETINKDYNKSVASLLVPELIKQGSLALGIYGGIKTAKLLKGTTKKDIEVVRDYREKHPGSNLSDTEILRAMTKR